MTRRDGPVKPEERYKEIAQAIAKRLECENWCALETEIISALSTVAREAADHPSALECLCVPLKGRKNIAQISPDCPQHGGRGIQ